MTTASQNAAPEQGSGSGVASAQPRLSADRVKDILIVDDHPLMCDALAATLNYAFGLRKVRIAASLAGALDNIRALSRDGGDALVQKVIAAYVGDTPRHLATGTRAARPPIDD